MDTSADVRGASGQDANAFLVAAFKREHLVWVCDLMGDRLGGNVGTRCLALEEIIGRRRTLSYRCTYLSSVTLAEISQSKSRLLARILAESCCIPFGRVVTAVMDKYIGSTLLLHPLLQITTIDNILDPSP